MGTWSWGGVYGHHWGHGDDRQSIDRVEIPFQCRVGMVGGFVGELMAAAYGG
jgi:hypothetical protein